MTALAKAGHTKGKDLPDHLRGRLCLQLAMSDTRTCLTQVDQHVKGHMDTHECKCTEIQARDAILKVLPS